MRESINIEGYGYRSNPIPAASRIGNIFVTGGIHAMDPQTGEISPGADTQCANVFSNVRRILAAAGATPENIIKMTFWVRDETMRDTINMHWLQMFPDPRSRPARYTIILETLAPAWHLQCEAIAVIENA